MVASDAAETAEETAEVQLVRTEGAFDRGSEAAGWSIVLDTEAAEDAAEEQLVRTEGGFDGGGGGVTRRLSLAASARWLSAG